MSLEQQQEDLDVVDGLIYRLLNTQPESMVMIQLTSLNLMC